MVKQDWKASLGASSALRTIATIVSVSARDFNAGLLGRTSQTLVMTMRPFRRDAIEGPATEEFSVVANQLSTARSLSAEGHHGPAVVLAGTTAEVYFQAAVTALFTTRGLGILDPIVRQLVPQRTFI